MFSMITGIEFGTSGIVLKTNTTDTFISSETFDVFTIRRVGCRINFQGNKSGSITFWHCANLQDAKDFITWMAGTQEDSKCI